MAAQTITVNTNFDSLTGLLAGETVTINNKARLTINSDPQINRVLMGDIAINDGECFVDGTTVRLINFSTASSLPVVGDTLTSGLVTGQVIGVSGTTTSGSIRLRSLNGSIPSGSTLTFTGGKTAVSSGIDTVGWLRILGAETKGWITTRQGKLNIQGQWFELGVSTGTASQVINHYTNDAIPAVWVETGLNTGIYEIWLNGGDRFPTFIGDGLRGKFFGSVNGNANITFGNGTLGAIPPTGARIRVPNITIGSALTTAPTVGTINATLVNRYDINTTSSGEVLISKCLGSGFYINTNQAYSLVVEDSGFLHNIAASEIASNCILRRVGVGLLGALIFQASTFTNLQSLILEDCVIACYSRGPAEVSTLIQDSNNVNITRGYYTFFARSDFRSSTISLIRCSSFNLYEVTSVGGLMNVITSTKGSILNLISSDTTQGENITTTPTFSIELSNKTDNVKVDGIKILSGGTNPRYALIYLNNTTDIKIRNIGSISTPFDMKLQTQYIVNTSGLVSPSTVFNIEIARVYAINSVTSFKNDTNIVSGLTLLNAWSDFNDVINNQSLNARYSGLRGGNNTHGATGIVSALTSVYGTHFYDTFFSTTTGAIGLHMLEKTNIEPSASTYTIDSGTPVFNSQGALRARTIGDQITWTCPWFVIGHTGFQNVSPNLASAVNPGNHLIQYRLDTGLGFSGPFKTATGANLSSETISSVTGFRIQIRITITATNANNSISGLFLPTITNATAQQELYPLDLTSATFSLSGLIPGSEIRLFRQSDGVEIGGVESSGATFSYLYTHFGSDIPIRFVVLNPGYIAIDVPVILTNQSANLPIQQRGDYSYA